METTNIKRLRDFVTAFASLLDQNPKEPEILEKGSELLRELIKTDDWLPNEFAQPHPQYYQQYLLHSDSLERFSVVSFVWGPGQTTPIHNHTVWGLVGVLRGAEFAQNYQEQEGHLLKSGNVETLTQGRVEPVSPTVGDLHKVSNAFDDQVSISIHVYGANIGAVNRSVFYEDGSSKPFISGYSNKVIPNIWDRSVELRTN
ncbi:cysteine dioxygenase [Solitalea longa]|uniref:Cysteine dioxygenase n=1 Tax=Solitalea longa TaxID=2079460 RepID=A0A2S5AA26_9SPHI|nr:cysteine dioxygenase [Solitalea longa]POY38973.1 cysteine dioxygenase [Solitalea longa]